MVALSFLVSQRGHRILNNTMLKHAWGRKNYFKILNTINIFGQHNLAKNHEKYIVDISYLFAVTKFSRSRFIYPFVPTRSELTIVTNLFRCN